MIVNPFSSGHSFAVDLENMKKARVCRRARLTPCEFKEFMCLKYGGTG